MKHCFLSFTVAFLFVLAGCGSKKKTFSKKVVVMSSGQNSRHDLITRTTSVKLQKAEKKASKKQAQVQDRIAQAESQGFKEQIRLVEVRLADIPSPVLVQAVAAHVDPQGCYSLVYESPLSFSELVAFYKTEMEQAGWHKGAFFEHEEFLCSFKKDQSSCIISVRPSQKKWGVSSPATIHIYAQL